jgi:hypothetical protein
MLDGSSGCLLEFDRGVLEMGKFCRRREGEEKIGSFLVSLFSWDRMRMPLFCRTGDEKAIT